MQRQYSNQLILMMGASGLLLLIACANIANLLLVRGMDARPRSVCAWLWVRVEAGSPAKC